MILSRVTSFLFLATLFCVSFEKIQWELAGTIGLAGILAVLFVASFTLERLGTWPRKIPRTVAIVLLFAAAFLVVYLAGFYNIETQQAAAQFAKGLARFAITFSFAAVGIAYLGRRPIAFYWVALGALCAGVALNGLYAVVQLAFAETGRDLDQTVLGPLLGEARPINFYGAVQGADVYRPNALTNDPNHLGIVLLLPLLILTPIYLRLERGHPLRVPLMLLLPFLLLVELATLSRSGLLGLFAGVLVLLFPYGRKLVSAAVLVPLGGLALVLAVIVSRRVDFFETVVRSRLDTESGSTATHFQVYELIRPALEGHWLFGLGLNTFSVYYEAATGLTNWGPHSFYAALLIETGIAGAAVFAAFIVWLFRRLRAGHRLGKALAQLRDPLAARVRPLAWGLTAAVVGVMAANAFYLTMQQSYFYALAMLALALPVVFGRRLPAA
ncbi:MAG TPA: O-antigen ligase family protein [Gaiellaceae bacterium]|nr:O-antigen ligase family protein [Gaiellaceae bacterium]